MPRHRTHLFAGFFGYLLVHALWSTWQPITGLRAFCGLTACLLGSLFPDIDIKSRMRNLFYTILGLILCSAILASSWLWFAVGSCAALGVALLSHRTLTHRVWFLALGPLPLALLASKQYPLHANLLWYSYACFFIGALTHIVLDRRVTAFKRWQRR